jgi:hypothetical protein
MLKELVIELAVLVGLVFCMLLFVPALLYPLTSELRGGPLPLIGFIGLIIYSIFHLKRLFNDGKTEHAVAFIIILVATIIISSIAFWILYRPLLV